MRQSGGGSIVNVASLAATYGMPYGLHYTTSKAAVIALTVQYAKNLTGMRVNVSDPGYTATDFNRHSGHQTVTEGTDATVALATIDQDGPTGEFHNRTGRIAY